LGKTGLLFAGSELLVDRAQVFHNQSPSNLSRSYLVSAPMTWSSRMTGRGPRQWSETRGTDAPGN